MIKHIFSDATVMRLDKKFQPFVLTTHISIKWNWHPRPKLSLFAKLVSREASAYIHNFIRLHKKNWLVAK